MKFTKYHGLGNDFIITNDNIDTNNIAKLCDRHFGIGADGLIINKIHKKDISYENEMVFYNADGTQASMCGNGIRCFTAHIMQEHKKEYDIITKAGIKKTEIVLNQYNKENKILVKVDMGEIKYIDKYIIDEIEIHYLNSGTEHAVIIVDDLSYEDNYVIIKNKEYNLIELGKKIENTIKYFPNKTNVNFVKILNNTNIKIITWERGVGVTLACGTGATASAYIVKEFFNLNNEITTHLLGGELFIQIYSDNYAEMTGEAIKVFEGVYDEKI